MRVMRGGGVLVAVVMIACGAATRPNDPITCGDRPELAGQCVGVSEAAICSGPMCVEGASCSRVHLPMTDGELQRMAMAAAPGECIVLGSGAWGALRIVGGVSVLGRGVSEVSSRSLAIVHADAHTSLVRGVAVNGTISAVGPGILELDRARTKDLRIESGSAIVRDSTIEGSSQSGVFHLCGDACAAGPRPRLSLERTLIRDVGKVGVWASHVDVELRHVVVDTVRPVDFQFGRGLELTGRSTLQASYLRIARAPETAMFVADSAGSIGPGLEIRDCGRGVHLGAIPEGGFVLDGFDIGRVGGVAVTMGKGSRGVVLRNGRIDATTLTNVPVDVGGVVEVGDGIVWGRGVEGEVAASVTISGSARVPALIDASATGSFSATLAGADASKGVVVTHAKSRSDHPALTIASGTKVVYADDFPSADP